MNRRQFFSLGIKTAGAIGAAAAANYAGSNAWAENATAIGQPNPRRPR